MAAADPKKKRIRRILTAIVLFAAVAAVTLFFYVQRQKKAQMTSKMQTQDTISTVKVQKMNLSNSISVTGTVESVDSRSVTSELKSVEVAEVMASVGEKVSKGQVIVRFDSTDFEESLAESKNNYSVNKQLESLKDSPLEIYNAAVEKAQKTYDNTAITYHTKQAEYETAKKSYRQTLIKACDLFEIVYSGDEDLSSLQAKVNAASAGLSQSDENYTEKSSAVKSCQEALQSMNSAENSYISAESAVITAKQTYDDEIEKAQKTYQENTLSDKLITKDSDLESIESYEEQIDKCVIVAPADGVISQLDLKAGDTFGGGTVFEMLDNEHFKVTATVDEYDINSVSLGQRAYIKTNPTGDEELPATVTFVAVTSSSSQMSTSATYQIEITLDDAQPLLRTGMTASVSIELESASNVLAVPYDCVTTDKSGKSSITIKDGDTTKVVEVNKGLETDYYVEISGEGITEGTEVVLPVSLVNTKSDSQEMGFSFEMGMPGDNMPGSGGRGNGGNGGPGGMNERN